MFDKHFFINRKSLNVFVRRRHSTTPFKLTFEYITYNIGRFFTLHSIDIIFCVNIILTKIHQHPPWGERERKKGRSCEMIRMNKTETKGRDKDQKPTILKLLFCMLYPFLVTHHQNDFVITFFSLSHSLFFSFLFFLSHSLSRLILNNFSIYFALQIQNVYLKDENLCYFCWLLLRLKLSSVMKLNFYYLSKLDCMFVCLFAKG